MLIDEAQDLPTSFFKLAYAVTTSPKRIVWAYDELQQLSADSVPSAADLFGRNSAGEPLVRLENHDGAAHGDVVLPMCYRNPPWTLTIAHGLGFGTARQQKGLVQHFGEPELWEDVGYQAVAGQLRLGAPVTLRRRSDSYPEFFADEFADDLDTVVQVQSFKREADQFAWVAQSVSTQLAKDELEHDDFLIVLPDEYTAKSRSTMMISALAQHGIKAHHAGVHTARDVVFQENSIAIAHIYRAKGNEAPYVYVLDADFAEGASDTALGLASRRNKLFTAITRSRAWVCICGVGRDMDALAAEARKIQSDGYVLSFTLPTATGLASIRQLHRDRTELEQRRIARQKQNLRQVAKALAQGEISASEFDALDPEERRAMKRALQALGGDEDE